MPGEPLKLPMNWFLLESPAKSNKCRRAFHCHLKDWYSSSRNQAASLPLSSRAEAYDIYMENEERPAVWFPPPPFFLPWGNCSLMQEKCEFTHSGASSHVIRNPFAREGVSFSLSEAAFVWGKHEREGIFLGDSKGIKASRRAHGLDMSPIKKPPRTHLTLVGKPGAVVIHSLIWEISTVTPEIIKILGNEFSGFACDFHFLLTDRKKLHLWIFLLETRAPQTSFLKFGLPCSHHVKV